MCLQIRRTRTRVLRDGVTKVATPATSSPDIVRNMPIDLFLDYLAIQLNPKKADGKVASVKLVMPDTKQSFLLTLENSVINHIKSRDGQKVDVTLTLNASSKRRRRAGGTTKPCRPAR